jgi:hypothetical protein
MATGRYTPRMAATCACTGRGHLLVSITVPTALMLVYNLPVTEAIFERFGGVDGSAYLVGGLGMTALVTNDIVVVPIRSGVGLRLGANFGYLKFSRGPTWNPF